LLELAAAAALAPPLLRAAEAGRGVAECTIDACADAAGVAFFPRAAFTAVEDEAAAADGATIEGR
jgi:hypothetical protein